MHKERPDPDFAVDLYQNTGNGWEILRLRDETDTLQLRSIKFSVVLKELYEDLADTL